MGIDSIAHLSDREFGVAVLLVVYTAMFIAGCIFDRRSR